MGINGLRLTQSGRAKADLFVYLFTMMSEQEMDATLKGLFEGLEFQAEPAGLYDPLRYMMSIGGKRIRPRLCLLAFSLFDEVADERILEPAAGLEIFHAFTLLHDDIMDKSDTRRGHETVWKRWDVNTAILSGDVMSIESFRRMAAAPREVLPLVLSVFTKTAAQVCDGQQMDMDFETRERVPMAEYMEMIGLKTAVLLACSAKIGALIGGASSFEAQALYDYGYDLGLTTSTSMPTLPSSASPSAATSATTRRAGCSCAPSRRPPTAARWRRRCGSGTRRRSTTPCAASTTRLTSPETRAPRLPATRKKPSPT